MSLRPLQPVNLAPLRCRADIPASVLDVWAQRPLLAESDDPNTLSIYGPIGDDYDNGYSAKRTAAALRKIGARPVTVNINSPGGYADEGIAIYNLLAEHPAEVVVKVMGLAASAASIIAMAGDEILMGRGALLMIHNAWGLALGNRHDMTETAKQLEVYDHALAEIYARRVSQPLAYILALMDGDGKRADGHWFTAEEAITQGFADAHLDDDPVLSDPVASVPQPILARRRIEAALAKQGLTRAERKALIDAAAPRDACRSPMRDAGESLTAADIAAAIQTLTGA